MAAVLAADAEVEVGVGEGYPSCSPALYRPEGCKVPITAEPYPEVTVEAFSEVLVVQVVHGVEGVAP